MHSTGTARGIRDFKGKRKEVAVRYDGKKTLVFCGLGPTVDADAANLRAAAANGIREALALGRKTVSLCVPTTPRRLAKAWPAALEGALLGAYRFRRYKTEKDDHALLSSLELVSDAATTGEVTRTHNICDAVCYARELVNDNACRVTPHYLAEQARTVARHAGMKIVVLKRKEIQTQKLGLLAAVGQGSPYPPRLVLMHYRGAPADKAVTAVVGKGITFDAGGANLKPSGHIETMRTDMAGAAVVLGLMKALGSLKPKVNIVGVFAAAHNAVDGRSYLPGDIYRSFSGKTVEIGNTDAEGRLILADAISYCIRKVKPARIIDLATLTGGILVALGEMAAGLFSNNEKLAAELLTAARKTNERLWRMPLYPEYAEAMKSDLADLRNTSTFKRGHASPGTGAAFIGQFLENTPWAHVDMAGVAYNQSKPRGEIPKFATGYGVRLLVECLG